MLCRVHKLNLRACKCHWEQKIIAASNKLVWEWRYFPPEEIKIQLLQIYHARMSLLTHILILLFKIHLALAEWISCYNILQVGVSVKILPNERVYSRLLKCNWSGMSVPISWLTGLFKCRFITLTRYPGSPNSPLSPLSPGGPWSKTEEYVDIKDPQNHIGISNERWEKIIVSNSLCRLEDQ